MTRNQRILHDIHVAKEIGLEIGPLTAPVVRKEEGNIFYLDHMSYEDLCKKYKDEPVDLDLIVPVDYVLLNNSLKESVRGQKFDYVVASHVIEHIPNIVEWLRDIASVLKPGGIVTLAIPDKRYTFDIERRVSLPADVIGAYLDKDFRFTSAAMYDASVAYAENIDTAKAWAGHYIENPAKHRWTQSEVYKMCLDNLKPDVYIDCHCFVFTPRSFLAILADLTKLNLIDYELGYFLETQPGELEFYVSLKKVDIYRADKKALLRKIKKVTPTSKKDMLLEEVEALRKELNDIRQSRSWKVTQPLRSASKLRKN
jgi:SAM-dependent methyltransferase